MSIEVNYNAIDEFQLLMLQDAINLMKSISKISVSPKYNATANHGKSKIYLANGFNIAVTYVFLTLYYAIK